MTTLRPGAIIHGIECVKFFALVPNLARTVRRLRSLLFRGRWGRPLPTEALAVIVFHGQLSFHLPNRVASSLIIVALGPLRTLQFRHLMIFRCKRFNIPYLLVDVLCSFNFDILKPCCHRVSQSTFFLLAKSRRLFIDNSSIGSFKNT